MEKVTIYQKPTCSTCRQAVQLLTESGKPFTAVNYYEKPFTKVQLKTLLKKAGLSPKDILRTKEDIYKELSLAKKNLSDDEWLDVMVAHPDLIQRPIVEKGREGDLGQTGRVCERIAVATGPTFRILRSRQFVLIRHETVVPGQSPPVHVSRRSPLSPWPHRGRDRPI